MSATVSTATIPTVTLSSNQTTCQSVKVAIVMGSQSDWPTMIEAANILDQLQVPYQVEIVSAHRTPDKLFSFAENAQAVGLQIIIAGAGGAAHLPAC